MSKYETLRQQFISAKSTDVQYWESLQEMISRIRREFSDFLEIPSEITVLVDGKEAPAVVIGKLDNGKLRLIPYADLPKSGRSITFDLQLTFDRETYSKPRNYTIFSLSISKDRPGFAVEVFGPDGTTDFIGPHFRELYEHLYSAATKAIAY